MSRYINQFVVKDESLLLWRNSVSETLREKTVSHLSYVQIQPVKRSPFIQTQSLLLLTSFQFLSFPNMELSALRGKALNAWDGYKEMPP